MAHRRQTDTRNSRPTGSGSDGIRNATIRPKEKGWRNGVLEGRGDGFALQERPSFTKSVFAAGTAKRRTEMLRRKAGLAAQDGEEEEQESAGRRARGAGGKDQTASSFTLS